MKIPPACGLIAVVALIATGCGGGSKDSASSTAETATLSTTSTAPAPPQRSPERAGKRRPGDHARGTAPAAPQPGAVHGATSYARAAQRACARARRGYRPAPPPHSPQQAARYARASLPFAARVLGTLKKVKPSRSSRAMALHLKAEFGGLVGAYERTAAAPSGQGLPPQALLGIERNVAQSAAAIGAPACAPGHTLH